MMKFLLLLLLFMLMNFFNKKKFLIKNNQIMYNLILFLLIIMNNNSNFFIKMNLNLSINKTSYILIILLMWISFLMTLNLNFKAKNLLMCMNLFILMNLILTMLFSSINWMMFYILFELSLIPTMMLILGWGTYNDRIKANFMMMMYTMISSMPFLMYMIISFINFNSLSMMIMNESTNYFFINNFYYLMMIITFLVKLPMFMLHMWLPKAHVEAPIYGSMILAAILLKIGSFGLMKINFLMNIFSLKLSPMISSLSLYGSIILSLICLFNYDMKIIIAYSSVIHMSLMISNLMNLNKSGIYGSISMMISHGLCSSGLFCLTNLIYINSKSRNMSINKGLINLSPPLTLSCFLMCSSNMSSPPSLNLISEIMLIMSMIKYSFNSIYLIILLCFFSSIYSIYLYMNSQFNLTIKTFKLFNLKTMNFYMMLMHWIPLNFFFLNLFYL
uniref:NADH-ubiquinone oxidoreductase chain 4 n=1 Tax=Orthogonalys pulchella TaxID=32427 RepID=A0A096XMZ1_9HYME|nr:NADH dehydrogenase subunit 4 [Orthogonalys pulchella]AIC37443.1 NADH dehydrogenase subunit 4 [Orthogonalys pulchella]